MTISQLTVATSLLYCFLGISFWRLADHPQPSRSKTGILLSITTLTLALHVVLLYKSLLYPEGVDLSFANSVSLTSALISLLFLTTSFFTPNPSLGVLVMLIGALSVIYTGTSHNSQLLDNSLASSLIAHIGFSLIAYSLLFISALQALLMAYQERQLHNRTAGKLVRSLPALELMERLLFRLIGWGFLFLSLGLITGFLFLEDLFAQHLVQKTVLSLFAWVIFAILLLGRWRSGWRGRTAIRWSLGGFLLLLLGYLGSKFALEVLLRN